MPSLLSVVIPAYNEARRIRPTIEGFLAHLEGRRPFEILVVDDGSKDETTPVATEALKDRGRVLRRDFNNGKGEAVRRGVFEARGDRILMADADGAAPPPMVERLDSAIDDGADFAIGSRAEPAGEGTVTRLRGRGFSSGIFNKVTRWGGVPGIADTQCGFKLFKADPARAVFSRMKIPGFAFDVEILFLARRLGYAIREVPIEWHDQEGSKVRVIRDGLKMALDVLKIRWLHRGNA